MQTEIVKRYLFQYRTYQSLYSQVTNFVVVGNSISEPFIARKDLLQECCLSPTLVRYLLITMAQNGRGNVLKHDSTSITYYFLTFQSL